MRAAFALLLLSVLLVEAQSPIRFGLPPRVEAGPGDYATLFFQIEGRGAGRLELEAPEGWLPLALPERIVLTPPRTPVVVTLRVPETALAGRSYPVVLRFCPEGSGCLPAEGRVTVLHRPALALHVEPETEGVVGEPVAIRVTVTNRGNRTDRVELRARANTGLAVIEPGVLELEPGETAYATLRLGLRPEERISPGYQMSTWVEARSRYGPIARARTLTRWSPPGGGIAGDGEPTLRFRLSGSVGLGVGLKEGRLSGWRFDYGLAPHLEGELSDFVAIQARTNPIERSEEAIWPEPPRSLEAELSGEGWRTALTLGDRRASLGFSLQPGNWRYELGALTRYDLREFLINAGLSSARRELNLQLAGQLRYREGRRSERLSVRHVRPLGGGWSLRLAGQYAGDQGERAYRGVFAARPELVWRGPAHNLVAGFTLAPQIGLYAASLSGGMRHFYPFGIRGAFNYRTDPGGDRYRIFATAVAVPGPGSVLQMDAGVVREPEKPWRLELAPSLNYLTGIGGGNRVQLGLGYRLGYRWATGETTHALRFSLGARSLSYSLTTRLGYVVGDPAPTGSVTLALQPGPDDRFELAYRREEARTIYRASWERRWGGGLRSFVGFQRSEEPAPIDRFRAGLILEKIGGGPLGLRLGYTLLDRDGLGEGSGELEHRFQLGLAFGFRERFATPDPVVQAFGGRREGVVSGQVFVDENQNGLRDPEEAPLAGVRVLLGRARAESDAEGSFTLRVRPGRYPVRLGNLPADLALYREITVEVRQDGRHVLDLPLARTAQVAVWVYHDANHNGRPDPGEPGIPYAGIRIEGRAGSRTVRADAEGRALIGGLLPGTTRFAPDPASLPPRYRATGEPLEVALAPGRHPEELALGAAPPPKRLATTFEPGTLSVFAHLPQPTAVAGGELEIRALITGTAERVWVEFPNGTTAPLQAVAEGRFEGRVRIPEGIGPGPLALKVRAEGAGKLAETIAFATVVPGKPYGIEPLRAKTGTFEIRVELRFHARTLILKRADGTAIELQSEDGYRWRGRVRADRPGPLRLTPIADGRALEPAVIEVVTGKEEVP